MDSKDIKEHFQHLLKLLEIEKKEDLEQYKKLMSDSSIEERKNKGICWYPVQLEKSSFDAGARAIIKVSRKQEQAHVFQTGKTVSLFSLAGNNDETSESSKGVINQVKGNEMIITLNEDDIPEWISEGNLGVQLLFDEGAYRELERALTIAMNGEEPQLIKMREILLGNRKASFSKKYEFDIPYLNDSQNEAFKNTLAAEDVAIIHGPPGTGKTTTLVQCIIQDLKENDQVLVTAPSNAAVDLLTDKLVEKGINVLRLGHPARVTDRLLQQTVDYKITKHLRYKELKAIKQQEAQYRDAAAKFKRNFGSDQRRERKMLYVEANKLRKEIRSLSDYISNDIFEKAEVITCTLVGATTQLMRSKRFSTAYIDEAAQALEAATWIPILKADKIVLAGDHQQLPPTIKSVEAAKEGMDKTLFENVIKQKSVDVMLKEQYRMNKDIMNFPSDYFYDGKLIANDEVQDWKIYDEDQPLEFIDTAGTGFQDQVAPESLSTYNKEEAELLQKHLTQYINIVNGSNQLDNIGSIGIITPYKAQVKVLKELVQQMDIPSIVRKKINVNTVDSFQGQERDIIYISLVRSNDDGIIGFLSNARRMNVAMTRARKKLVVIGDSATISRNKFYSKFIDYVNEIGAYRSAFELMYD
ncbi:IGHMBP2 family helicase [Flammeovirga pectinis]|uniref:DNA helicase n=1 Tax=Flammeovirga pectinis TaxID=2494373 RepID=A0A3S9P243_9BACT|nr:AAA domain-containing protein [Flammeovirga pectinis]AZQ62225.1 IGHMBP2 family helicase [Flammeovirga pectinis]